MEYRDTGKPGSPDDQLLRWINVSGSGMAAMGGIRPLPNKNRESPKLLVLFSSEETGNLRKPWIDRFDAGSRRLEYCGDAKAVPGKGLRDFRGNAALMRAWRAMRSGTRTESPLVLYFRRERKGWVRFLGLGLLTGLTVEAFADRGELIPNYLASVRFFPDRTVSVEWLRRWAEPGPLPAVSDAPAGFAHWVLAGAMLGDPLSVELDGVGLADEPQAPAPLSELPLALPELPDERQRVLRAMAVRRGQPAFRQRLLAAYQGGCAVTGCAVEAVLEAAHIVPYRGPGSNLTSNGLLLRADIHTLFDRRLLWFEPDSHAVEVSSLLRGSDYEVLEGRPLRPTRRVIERPSESGLEFVRQQALAAA